MDIIKTRKATIVGLDLQKRFGELLDLLQESIAQIRNASTVGELRLLEERVNNLTRRASFYNFHVIQYSVKYYYIENPNKPDWAIAKDLDSLSRAFKSMINEIWG